MAARIACIAIAALLAPVVDAADPWVVPGHDELPPGAAWWTANGNLMTVGSQVTLYDVDQAKPLKVWAVVPGNATDDALRGFWLDPPLFQDGASRFMVATACRWSYGMKCRPDSESSRIVLLDLDQTRLVSLAIDGCLLEAVFDEPRNIAVLAVADLGHYDCEYYNTFSKVAQAQRLVAINLHQGSILWDVQPGHRGQCCLPFHTPGQSMHFTSEGILAYHGPGDTRVTLVTPEGMQSALEMPSVLYSTVHDQANHLLYAAEIEGLHWVLHVYNDEFQRVGRIPMSFKEVGRLGLAANNTLLVVEAWTPPEDPGTGGIDVFARFALPSGLSEPADAPTHLGHHQDAPGSPVGYANGTVIAMSTLRRGHGGAHDIVWWDVQSRREVGRRAVGDDIHALSHDPSSQRLAGLLFGGGERRQGVGAFVVLDGQGRDDWLRKDLFLGGGYCGEYEARPPVGQPFRLAVPDPETGDTYVFRQTPSSMGVLKEQDWDLDTMRLVVRQPVAGTEVVMDIPPEAYHDHVEQEFRAQTFFPNGTVVIERCRVAWRLQEPAMDASGSGLAGCLVAIALLLAWKRRRPASRQDR